MRNHTVRIFLVIFSVLLLAGCACNHQWAGATCTEARTCTLCAETEGTAGGHAWTDATCKDPAACLRCGITQGNAAGHTAAPQRVSGIDPVELTQYWEVSCQRCGVLLESGQTELTQLHDGQQFLITPEEFCQRIQYIQQREFLVGDTAQITQSEPYQCQLHYTDERLEFELRSLCSFYSGENPVSACAEDQSFDRIEIELGVNQPLVDMVFTNHSLIHLLPVIMTCDPLTDYTDAQDLSYLLFEQNESSLNGLDYRFTLSDQEHMMLVITLET